MNRKSYESDEERWSEIAKVKKKVAQSLQIPHGSMVLDVLVGEGDFTRSVAESSKGSRVVAGEINISDINEAKRRIERDGLEERIELLRMDITCMAFVEGSFDYVVNFSGWEDFTAVSGEELIDKAFNEIVSVLKANGILAVTFIPALESKDEVSIRDKELQEYTYKSSKRPKYFHERFFLQIFEKHEIKLLTKKTLETAKSRLRPPDAKGFIEWHCKNYRGFYAPDVKMRSYEEIFREFQEFIEKHGIRERRSKIILLIGKKST